MKVAGALVCAALLCGPAFAGGPKVVSLDYCADQFVLAMADEDQILALSKDADKPFSHLRNKAAGHRQVRSSAEDVVALQPDLVVRSWGGDARAIGLYEQFGIGVYQIGYASDFEGAAAVTREAGAALGHSERGDALVAAMGSRADPTGREALYLTPSGVTAGNGTMIDAILEGAGLDNAVRESGWISLDLEGLVLRPPALVVSAFFGFDADASDQWSAGRHPVLRHLMDRAQVIAMDESELTCPAWFVADAAADLSAGLEDAP